MVKIDFLHENSFFSVSIRITTAFGNFGSLELSFLVVWNLFCYGDNIKYFPMGLSVRVAGYSSFSAILVVMLHSVEQAYGSR
jgi:hypothetical protein